VKASFDPIAAFYQDPMQAWIYANSEASESRDALGPDAWDTYSEMRKYSATSPWAGNGEKSFQKMAR